jgi:hypothetical protein
MHKSKYSGASGSGSSSRNNDRNTNERKIGNRFSTGTYLIDEEEYKFGWTSSFFKYIKITFFNIKKNKKKRSQSNLQ